MNYFHCVLKIQYRFNLSNACVLIVCAKSLRLRQLYATLWSVAHKTPLSMGFSKQEYWSGLSCPSPGDLPDPGIKPTSLISPALAGRFFMASATSEAGSKQQKSFLESLVKPLIPHIRASCSGLITFQRPHLQF